MKIRHNKMILLTMMTALVLQSALVWSEGNSESETAKPVEIEWMWNKADEGNQWSASQDLAESLGITLNLTYVPNDKIRDVIAVRTAGGKLPDIFQVEDYPAYKDLQEGGILVNLSKAMKTGKYPHLQNYFDRYKSKKIDQFRTNGEFFRIPIKVTSSWDHAIYYRADWAEALDLKVPETVEELGPFAKAMMEANLDGMADPPYGISAISFWAFGHLATSFTGYTIPGWRDPYFVEDNGKFMIAQTLDGYKDFLKYTQGLISEGILDVEILSHSNDVGKQKFASGRTAVWFGGGPDGRVNDLKKLNPNADVKAIVPFLDAGKGRYGLGGTGYYKAIVIAKNDDAKSDAALRFLNEGYSEESLNEIWGKKIWHSGDETKLGFNVAMSSMGWGEHRDWESYKANNPVSYKVTHYLEVEHPEAMKGINLKSEEYGTELSKVVMPEVTSVIQEYRARFLLGELDIDKHWDEYLAEIKKAGEDELIADITNFWK